ncbi:MAG: class II 3-deoxy-7-phosphoheptulonate synthase [Alphaproteobacteria bacterium]
MNLNPAHAYQKHDPNQWSPASWRHKPIRQVPDYNDKTALKNVETELAKLPPLVFSGECEKLKTALADCARGKAFLLQGGDCAESFLEFSANGIRDTFRVILQMAVVLTFAGEKPVVKLGRMAGQFAKPRSEDMEEKNGITLPSYRGDIINDMAFDEKSRLPDPYRMVRAYHQSAATLNLLRAFADGGYADLHMVKNWMLDFVAQSPKAHETTLRFQTLADEIDKAMTFMTSCGLTAETSSELKRTDFYVSHEALLLWYEEAITRQDSLNHQFYDCAGHFVWVGDRTRFLESAHIEFLRGIANPLGIKCGPKTDPAELVKILDLLNPEKTAGKITLIMRFGIGQVEKYLPAIVKAVEKSNHSVVWSCDPMHGNTIKQQSKNGIFKTRVLDSIFGEVKEFFQTMKKLSHIVGGIHIEMTGKNVTECLGGTREIRPDDLADRYHTHCDPRLNGEQALELSFMLADMITDHQ